MPKETHWLSYAQELLRQREGKTEIAVLALRAEAAKDEWLRGYLVKLGAEQLMWQARRL